MSLTILLLMISYLNVMSSPENDWLQTVSKTLNITLLVILILGLIIGSMVYYYYIIHIEDLNRQCYVNLCVFFSSLFCIIVFIIVANLVEYRIDPNDSKIVLTLINFFLLLVVLIIAVSGVLMLTILIMSSFWCFQIRAKNAVERSPAT